jgi:hypothetical protein
MNETIHQAATLSIFVYDSVSVSEKILIEIILLKFMVDNHVAFSTQEITSLREILRISIGNHVNNLTNEQLIDFGTSILHTTAIVLKAKHQHHLRENR